MLDGSTVALKLPLASAVVEPRLPTVWPLVVTTVNVTVLPGGQFVPLMTLSSTDPRTSGYCAAAGAAANPMTRRPRQRIRRSMCVVLPDARTFRDGPI